MTPSQQRILDDWRADLPQVLEGFDPHPMTNSLCRCSHCGMHFRVGWPLTHKGRLRGKATWTTCAERNCTTLFWHVGVCPKSAKAYGVQPNTAVCGISPNDIPELRRHAEERPAPRAGRPSLNYAVPVDRSPSQAREGAAAFLGGEG